MLHRNRAATLHSQDIGYLWQCMYNGPYRQALSAVSGESNHFEDYTQAPLTVSHLSAIMVCPQCCDGDYHNRGRGLIDQKRSKAIKSDL